jgi:rhodanese-related sulfurtransferase
MERMARTATGRLTVDDLVAEAREAIDRLAPALAWNAVRGGARIVDIRSDTSRARDGIVPGSFHIPRTVLEWRLDPASDAAIPEATGYDLHVVVLCRQGYSSSLAAACLRDVGLWRATDVIGGVEAWGEAGLPLDDGPADVRY